MPGTIQETPGEGRDIRDTAGSGDAEFWRHEWDKYEDDNAVVDVDVRGWIYCPHRGPLNRKHRLFVGLARQMVGIPAPSGKSTTGSSTNSRASSPHGMKELLEAKSAENEEELVAKEVKLLVETGEAEADVAVQGGYSENSAGDPENSEFSHPQPHATSPSKIRERFPDTLRGRVPSGHDNPKIEPLEKRSSWLAPSQMSSVELSVANVRLMKRLEPFLANPLTSIPISAFFYNANTSRQRTIDTDASGHFSIHAALDFVPTHVRILASEKLSITEEVSITEPSGVSVISDIDDTIKHSAIGSGAREIFRNVFIRDLGDLSIPGVKDWYSRMADMGVKFHYVSNSPWQLYPVLTAFFAMAGFPAGSFHLKQYSGMFQGIFEPVAERKKSTLEKIMRDFPDRRFLLVGDSGEADLEVYTDVVLENPGRILGVFIRDVTTSPKTEFFDSAIGPFSSDRLPKSDVADGPSGSKNNIIKVSRPMEDENDPSLKATIAASLRDTNKQTQLNGKQPRMVELLNEDQTPALPSRRRTAPRNYGENLIDLESYYDKPSAYYPTRANQPSRAPLQNQKSLNLSKNLGESLSPPSFSPKQPPPRPRKPSTSVNLHNLPISKTKGEPTAPTAPPKPPRLPAHTTYRAAARQKLSSAYNSLPSASAYLYGSDSSHDEHNPLSVTDFPESTPPSKPSKSTTNHSKPGSVTEPPQPLTIAARKPITSYSAAAAQYASTLYNSATGASTDSLNNNGVHGAVTVTTTSSSISTVNKKEELWKRRWARTKEILDAKGVMLRSWRVGGDAIGDAVALVEEAGKETSKGMEKTGEGEE